MVLLYTSTWASDRAVYGITLAPEDSVEIFTLIHKSWEYNQSDPLQALQLGKEALQKSQQAECTASEALSRVAIGVAYYYISDYITALDQFYKVLDINRDIKSKRILISAYTNIGNCFERLEQLDTALKWQKKALEETGIDNKYLVKRAIILNNMAKVFISQELYDSALVFQRQAYALQMDMGEHKSYGYSYKNIGHCYLKLNQYDSALYYLDQAYNAHETQGNAIEMVNTGIDLSEMYIALRAYNTAEDILMRVIAEANRLNYKKGERDGYGMASLLYEQSGDWSKAYAMHKNFFNLSEELHVINSKDQLRNLEIQNQLLAREYEVEALHQKQKYDQAILIALIILLVLVVMLAAAAVYHYGLKTRYARQQTELLSVEKKQKHDLLISKSQQLLSVSIGNQHRQDTLADVAATLDKLSRRAEYKSCSEIRMLRSKVKHNLQLDATWDDFKLHFEGVHPEFFDILRDRYKDLTDNELKLCAYMKLNLSTKEISRLMNISEKSVQMARYRMKKRMKIDADHDLKEVILST